MGSTCSFSSTMFYMVIISLTLHLIHVTCSIMSRRSFPETVSISPASFCKTKTLAEWYVYSLAKTGEEKRWRWRRRAAAAAEAEKVLDSRNSILSEMRDALERWRQKMSVSLRRTRRVEAGKGWWPSSVLWTTHPKCEAFMMSNQTL